MAQKTQLEAKVERRLRSVRQNFEALPWVAERWERDRREGRWDSDDAFADRAGFRAEWDDLIDRLDSLHGWYKRGEMTPTQRREYEATLGVIREMLAVVARLQLTPPPGAVLDHLAETSPQSSTAPR